MVNVYLLLAYLWFIKQTRMWANAQRDGRPVQCHKVWLTPTTRVVCSNTAKMLNPLKFAGVPQTNETNSAASGSKFNILSGYVEKVLMFNKFFSDCRYVP